MCFIERGLYVSLSISDFSVIFKFTSSEYLYLRYKYSTYVMKFVLTFTNILVILALILSNINVFLIT